MMKNQLLPGGARRRGQRGVAALTVSMLLLAAMALVAFYANRSLLFEQKSSANQVRAARAFEAAEAGLEWATALLNEVRPLDASCMPAATGLSFRERYVPSDATLALAPPAAARPACRLGAGALACHCPGPGHDAALGDADEPAFSVSFAAVPADPESVLVTALGCTGPQAPCLPGAAARADASARVSVALKLRPLLRALPVAALTAGGAVELGSAVRLANLDRASGGTLVLAGQGIAAGDAQLATLPGSPAGNALLTGDAGLAALAAAADGAAMFNAWFGMTPERYRAAAPVRVVRGDDPSGRAAALRAAYAQGYASFLVEGDLLLDAAGIGSPARPVTIVGAGVACSAPCAVHGLLYADVAERDASDLANVAVHGAVVTRGRHVQPLGGAIDYDPAVLRALRHRGAVFARVPGSWRDF